MTRPASLSSDAIQLSLPLIFFLLIVCLKITFVDSESDEFFNPTKCLRSGDRFVKDFIQYECFLDQNVAENDQGRGFVNLIGKPIGCVPTNRTSGPVIVPGATHTTLHFRYECIRDPTNTVILKITHCVDNAGQLVKIGDFFSQKGENGEHVSVECAGDELKAKKIVHKWTKCTLSNGRKLIEGNFVTDDVHKESLKSVLQKSEIISCVRDNADVALKCTGCVTSTGVHLGVTNYVNVAGQWTQCRKYKEGCRLINVTSDYVDCQFEGKNIGNGNYFQSKSGLSSFYCNHGVVTKQGCLLSGNLILVGDVRYLNDRPFLLIGCDLPDGKFKRFLDTWRDGSVMKRCSWLATVDGITQSQIVPFACVDGKETVPLNKIVQKTNGDYQKCAHSDENDLVLEMRSPTPEELDDHLKKKTTKLNLVEYYGIGGKSGALEKFHASNLAFGAPTRKVGEHEGCDNLLPFCQRLLGYCSFMKGFETGLSIEKESYAEFREVQSRFEKLAQSEQDPKAPAGCEGKQFLRLKKKYGLKSAFYIPKTPNTSGTVLS
uniref:Abnormal cell migration protein 18-like fibronectin type I domain-containing protein n=1 Tax=Ditylenchus dipsaci TaxID=166011 RepID=A0A915DB28_9BILA